MVEGVEDCTIWACRVIIFDVLNISAWSAVQIIDPLCQYLVMMGLILNPRLLNQNTGSPASG